MLVSVAVVRSGGALLVSVLAVLRWSLGLFKGEALQLLCCSYTIAPMKEQANPRKLTRAQLSQALDSVPMSHILGKTVSRELTPKQRAFAVEVAKGSTGAAAYRKAYSPKGKPKTHGDNASRLKGDERIQAEIQAYKAAIDAETYRTPAGLRSLIIQSLVQTIIDPDTPPAVRVQAAKVAGQITEVGLYTERKEVRTITSSEDARAKIMAELRQLTADDVQDVTIDDADSLMRELAISGESETHRTPTPQADSEESLAYIHTIPHEQPPLGTIPHESTSAATPLGPSTNSSDDTPPPSPQDDPPSSSGN